MIKKKTIILRHRKENLKKCSLHGLESRKDFQFFTYPTDFLPNLTGYIMLDVDAPPLSNEDQKYGLFVIDGTWRYAEVMKRWLHNQIILPRRSLPKVITTAYPRRQEVENGLASVEAIYAAYTILGIDPDGMLEHYYWKKLFLKNNVDFFENKS